MGIERIELVRANIDLVAPFVTSYGVETSRQLLYVHVIGDDAHGWGECVALTHPLYTSEYVDGCEAVITRYLLPLIHSHTTAEEFTASTNSLQGHFMAKAAVEMALLDYQLRARNVSLSSYLGATRTQVPSGVAVGIQPSLSSLLDVVGAYIAEGYQRIKLKIEPGNDIEPIRALRTEFGEDFALQVDANAAYSVDDAKHLAQLDKFNLLLIEQPLAEEDLLGHVQLAKRISTPVCLDESITSLSSAQQVVEMGACSVVNIKPGRVGGLLEAQKIHDFCFAHNIPVWCGGMFETGIGRAANIALAALPGFTLPGDISASRRYFHQDITTPFELENGSLAVPIGPGIGVDPLPESWKALSPTVSSYPL